MEVQEPFYMILNNANDPLSISQRQSVVKT